MSTHLLLFQSFFSFLHHSVFARFKLPVHKGYGLDLVSLGSILYILSFLDHAVMVPALIINHQPH